MRFTSLSASLIVAASCLTSLCYGAEHHRSAASTSKNQASVNVTRRVLDAGRLAMNISDRAFIAEYNFADGDSLGWYLAGSLWPFSPNKLRPDDPYGGPVAYDQGPWIIGKLNGVPAAAVTEWRGTYMPGPIIDGRPALDVRPQDASRYHPYRIDRKSRAEDRGDSLAWPADLGAPVDEQGKPLVLGDQMIWCVYNGADSTTWPLPWRPRVPNDSARPQFPRLPVEVHQAIYTHRASSKSDTSLLANVVFIEWTFINKGFLPVDSCYLGLWSDMDNSDSFNHPGVDSALSLAYSWIDHGSSNSGTVARAAGFALLYGPTVPDPLSTALVRGHAKSGFRNLGLSGFFGHGEDGGPDKDFRGAPQHIGAAWNLARGYDKLGRPIIDTSTMRPTRFPYGGDPVIGTGWLGTGIQSAEAGFMFFAGPFTFAPGDTQWMMSALVPADNGDNKGSITLLRDYARRLHAMEYEQMIAMGPAAFADPPEDDPPEMPAEISLSQNFPNPFNPTTTIRYSLPVTTHARLTVFDLLGQKVAVLLDGVTEAGDHKVEFNGAELASGVYFYRLETGGFSQTKKLCLIH